MLSLAFIMILAVLPVPIIYIFYRRYFIVKPSFLYHLEYYIYGVILALIILLLSRAVMVNVTFQSAAEGGFLYAALVEKSAAFIVILILMYQQRSMLMVLNSVISAMLLGLGFSTIENIFYALAVHKSLIVVRLFSSVPVHVLTCGIIGYFLALMRLSGSGSSKAGYAFLAFMVPFFFHGLYDTLLFTGGAITYWIAPLLIVLILTVEYMLAKSQTLPLLDGLKKHKMALEDWATVQRDPQYERWILRSMGSKNRKYVPLIHSSLSPVKISIIVLVFLGAAISLPMNNLIMDALSHKLKSEEVYMLFTLLPALYSLNLFAVGMVNPKYFQNSIIKIPIIIDVDMSIEGAVIKTIAYHVTSNNCYCKTVDRVEPGIPCSMTFTCSSFSSPKVTGVVVWDTHDEQKQLSGTLVRFLQKPLKFRIFLLKFNLYRITRGLSFNLRLPGFRSIRQLFVRPVSVMQKEWRFSKGHVLFEQGEAGSVFYLIKKGEVDIIKTLDTGEKILMTTLSEGDIFGEMAIVGDQPRLATAVCRTECVLAAAEADNLEALIEGNPVFAQRLIKSFANRLHASEQILLTNIANAEQAAKKREQKLLALFKFILYASGVRNLASPDITDAFIEGLSRKFNMETKTVRELISALINVKDDDQLNNVIESCMSRF